jgi:hypothetical protein
MKTSPNLSVDCSQTNGICLYSLVYIWGELGKNLSRQKRSREARGDYHLPSRSGVMLSY